MSLIVMDAWPFIKELKMLLQIRGEIIDKLNQQYKTDIFHGKMTAQQAIRSAKKAMQAGIDIIDYELNTYTMDIYGIKVRYCNDNPLTEQEEQRCQMLVVITNQLMAAFDGAPGNVSKALEKLKDYVQANSTKLSLTKKYVKYSLYFRYISVKEAIIFEVLSKCQVFYTIVRERRKSGKAFSLDPLIAFYDKIKEKLSIAHCFHETVLPRRQIRFIQKKNTDKLMKNALFEYVSARKYKQVKELLSKGAGLNEPGICERTKREMHCTHRACQLGDLEMCKILHAFNASWEVREKQGATPLHFAVQSGNYHLVKYLIEEVGVNIESKDIQERTPFYFACTEGDLPVIELLYNKGVDINNRSKLGRSALSKACYLGLVDVVKFLMGIPGIILNAADGKGRTALHNSVFGPKGGREGHKFGTNEKDSPECTQLLLQNGFDVDIEDLEHNTPLHVAMSSDGIDSMRILLAFHASLSKLNIYEETPLMTGAKFGHLESVKMLREEYGALLTVKDVFNKNLMLLCAKFRQDDGKNINRVFYYSTDELLKMAKDNVALVENSKNHITDWQTEIDNTFSQLLKERSRVMEELIYFCTKIRELNLQIHSLSLQQIQSLLSIIKNTEDENMNKLFIYFISQRTSQKINPITEEELHGFVRWALIENSHKIFDFINNNEKSLLRCFGLPQEGSKLVEELSKAVFKMMPEMKEKGLTYCFMKMNVNWIDFIDPSKNDNILHVLVRNKKVGTLIQILKILSGIKLQFLTNRFVVELLAENQHIKLQNKEEELPLQRLLKRLLLHENNEGFDPYRLALLIKDASASKLLEEKMNAQHAVAKSQYQVKEYRFQEETDQKEVEIFNKFEVESILQQILISLQEKKEQSLIIAQNPLLQSIPSYVPSLIDNFSEIWKRINERKLYLISEANQVSQLQILLSRDVIGIDIEYFYAQGATLISIMQISSLHQDFIIDFLTSATTHQQSYIFIQAVKHAFAPIAYSPSISKIMHGADNDLCVIKSLLNLSFINFIDTARIDVEIRKQQNIRGLAVLLNEYLHEYMSKDYQVSEWRIRPIPSSMIDYARRDSMVLPFLARKLLSLVEKGRLPELLTNGCRQARRNKKTNQLLIRSMQALH